ncbi:hypothetical protein [Hasllibacter sp. MH4015]|uniref:hypothetical protein n=1 Tax=Hasllibacter sp. MH4015 TaxID=2854029 RepID=UPI001CD59CDA|nr:hypothetical protein [Hasllibacter sp. MH4015]
MAYSDFQPAANADRPARGAREKTIAGSGVHSMGRIIILLFGLVFIGFLALVGYAYSGLMQPEVRSVTQPVTLDAD